MNLSGKLAVVFLSLSIALTTACSSGGGGGGPTPAAGNATYNGITTPAAINASNAKAIGKAAGESVQVADSSIGLPTAISINKNSTDLNRLNTVVLSSFNTLRLPSAAVIPGVCSNEPAGSASMSNNNLPTSGPADLTLTYNNCDTGGITITGMATAHFDDMSNPNSGFTFKYTDFKVTDINGTTTINMSMTCTAGLSSCTYDSDFRSADGTVNRVSNFTFTGDAKNGFSGSADLSYSTYGKISFNATGITYGGACGSLPNGGTISFSSTNGSAGTIIFHPDCSVSGTWTSLSGAGSF